MAEKTNHRTGRQEVTRRYRVSRRVRQLMVEHAARDLPFECCGLLVGQGTVVTDVVPMRNLERSSTRFQIDPVEHIALRRALRQSDNKLDVLGVYHSHPDGPARPSPRDVAEANYPEWLYVVIGLAGRRVRVRGFVVASNQVRPVRLSESG